MCTFTKLLIRLIQSPLVLLFLWWCLFCFYLPYILCKTICSALFYNRRQFRVRQQQQQQLEVRADGRRWVDKRWRRSARFAERLFHSTTSSRALSAVATENSVRALLNYNVPKWALSLSLSLSFSLSLTLPGLLWHSHSCLGYLPLALVPTLGEELSRICRAELSPLSVAIVAFSLLQFALAPGINW